MTSILTFAQMFPDSQRLWMPDVSSTYAADIDWLFYFTYWACVIAFVGIMGAMLFFAFRYRKRPGYVAKGASAHSNTLELTWSIIPTIIFLVIFYYGFKGYVNMATPPEYSYQVRVTAFKWGWAFTYPNGGVSADLYIPKDTPVELVLESQDVIHSLFIPAFRAKKDCVPGRFNKMWFEATALSPEEGFQLFCTEYCGTSHSKMLARVHVYDTSQFVVWLDELVDIRKEPPLEVGRKAYVAKACNTCHSIDGSSGTGPTWKNLYGYELSMNDGTKVLGDENYIRTSILNPGAQIHAGYQNVMASYQGRIKEDEITAIIEYMKSLSDKGPAPLEAWPEEEGGEGEGVEGEDGDGGEGGGGEGGGDEGGGSKSTAEGAPRSPTAISLNQ